VTLFHEEKQLEIDGLCDEDELKSSYMIPFHVEQSETTMVVCLQDENLNISTAVSAAERVIIFFIRFLCVVVLIAYDVLT
jgi:hypothetical protein